MGTSQATLDDYVFDFMKSHTSDITVFLNPCSLFLSAASIDRGIGTLIENDADIYFDFNPPIITNETVHQIFEGFVEVENPTVSSSDLYGDNQVSIFPNPAKNYIILEMDDFKSKIYEVFDLQGRKVLTGMLTSNQTNISISQLSKGTYTIVIQGQASKVVFVKE